MFLTKLNQKKAKVPDIFTLTKLNIEMQFALLENKEECFVEPLDVFISKCRL